MSQAGRTDQMNAVKMPQKDFDMDAAVKSGDNVTVMEAV